jgi:hypothetical protein
MHGGGGGLFQQQLLHQQLTGGLDAAEALTAWARLGLLAAVGVALLLSAALVLGLFCGCPAVNSTPGEPQLDVMNCYLVVIFFLIENMI